MAPLLGRTLGDFVLAEKIGAGSHGAVYRAVQPLLQRDAAVKVLHARGADPTEVARFLREVHLAARLDHPFAAHVYASGAEADGVLWIAMELVRGTTLDEILEARGPLPLERFLPLFERLCEVAHAAHELGIVHGDIKPANVMVVARAGRLSPKLLDLGVARPLAEARGGPAAGSPAYMAPEQAAGVCDARSDVHALGVLAFQSLTGRLPRRDQRAALGPGSPPPLDGVFARALAPRPDDRFPSALELAAAFRAASGLEAAAEALPRLPEPVRDAWLAGAPQPLADAVAALDCARNVHQARDAVRDVAHVAARWLGLLALACRTAAGPGPGSGTDDARLRPLLRLLRRQGLEDEEWLDLAALVLAPFAARPAAHPLPELVALLAGAEGGALRELVAGEAAARTGSTLEQTRDQVVANLPRVAAALRSLDFLLEYPIAVPRRDAADAWMGVRRAHGAGPPTIWLSGPPAPEGRLALCDRDGRPLVSLWPLAQVERPTPGAAETLFLLEGPARRGARLTALPFGFELQRDGVWEWLAEQVPFEEAHAVASRDEQNPYRGLEPFGIGDAARFFGREREAQAFVNRLRGTPLCAVVGPSGVGKSSFIQAGVIPSLPPGWRALIVRPGAAPLAGLLARLARHGEHLPGLSEGADAGGTLVLVVDQFEEVFTLCQDPSERARYAEALAAAAGAPDGNVRVILTMRDDFLGRAAELHALHDQLARGLELLATPRPEDLARILVEPARGAGYDFDDPGLPAQMVAAVAGQPGALPLLSFTCARLWELRDRHFKLLVRRAHDALGGVVGALSAHAEETLAAMPARRQRLVREALRHLVTAMGTRASLTRAELRQVTGDDPETDGVIEALVAARLLTASEGSGGEERIELVHEALLDAWPRLAAWRREDAAGARLRDQLRAAARQWDDRARPRGLLWRDEALDEYRVWRRRHAGPLLAVEEAFTAASLADAARGRRVRTALVVAAFLALAAGLAGFYRASERAQQARAEAWVRLRQLYADRGREALLAGDPDRALPYLSEAYTMGADGPVIRFLLAQAARPLRFPPIVVDAGPMWQAAWTPDGGRLLTVGARAVLWDAATGKRAHELEVAGEELTLGELSADGARALTLAGSAARIWGVADGAAGAVCAAGAPLAAASFSPDGRTVAVGGADGVTALCDAASGAMRRLEGPRAPVTAVAFSPDGRRLAAASMDLAVRLYDAATGDLAATLRGPTNPPTVLAFSPDGTRLAAGTTAARGGTDTTIRLWELPGGRELAVLRGHGGSITSLAFSPAGDRVLSGSMDNSARIWDAATGTLVATLQDGTMVSVFRASYAPDGATVATASADGTVRIWDAASATLVASLPGHRHMVQDAVFSPDGKRLATASMDGTGRIWRMQEGTLGRSFIAHAGAVLSVSFDPSGRRLVTLGKEGHARLWDVETATLLGEQAVEANGRGRRAAFSPDGRQVVVPDGARLRLWDLAGGGVRTVDAAGGDVMAAAFTADGAALVSGGDGGVRLWDPSSGKLRSTLADRPIVWDVAVSPDGRSIAGAGQDGGLRLWDAGSGALLETFRGHEGALTSAAFCDDGRLIATAGVDRRASIWRVSGGVPPITLEGHGGVVLDVGFSPDCALAVTTSSDRTTRFWSSADGMPLLILRGHSGSVQAVAVRPGGTMIATAGADGKINLWEIDRERRPAADIAAWVRCHVPYRLSEGHLVSAEVTCR